MKQMEKLRKWYYSHSINKYIIYNQLFPNPTTTYHNGSASFPYTRGCIEDSQRRHWLLTATVVPLSRWWRQPIHLMMSIRLRSHDGFGLYVRIRIQLNNGDDSHGGGTSDDRSDSDLLPRCNRLIVADNLSSSTWFLSLSTNNNVFWFFFGSVVCIGSWCIGSWIFGSSLDCFTNDIIKWIMYR